jgi:hypothetical protein
VGKRNETSGPDLLNVTIQSFVALLEMNIIHTYGFCGHGNESSDSVKNGKFIDFVSDIFSRKILFYLADCFS